MLSITKYFRLSILLKLSNTQHFLMGFILLILCNNQYFRGMDTSYTNQCADFFYGRYCLYYKIHSILRGRELLTLSTTQKFWGIDTAYTMQYAVFSLDRYCLQYEICIYLYFSGVDSAHAQHYKIFSGVNTAHTQRYAEISGDIYCLSFTIRCIFVGSILLILRNMQIFQRGRYCLCLALRNTFGCRYCLNYAIRSISMESILLILRNAQYFRRVDTVYTKQ